MEAGNFLTLPIFQMIASLNENINTGREERDREAEMKSKAKRVKQTPRKGGNTFEVIKLKQLSYKVAS